MKRYDVEAWKEYERLNVRSHLDYLHRMKTGEPHVCTGGCHAFWKELEATHG